MLASEELEYFANKLESWVLEIIKLDFSVGFLFAELFMELNNGHSEVCLFISFFPGFL